MQQRTNNIIICKQKSVDDNTNNKYNESCEQNKNILRDVS